EGKGHIGTAIGLYIFEYLIVVSYFTLSGFALIGNADNKDNLRNGIDRPTDEGGDNGCYITLGDYVEYTNAQPFYVGEIHLVFDSDLDRVTLKGGIQEICDCPTVCNKPLNMTPYTFPATMTKEFEVIADGEVIYKADDNCQRLVKIPLNKTVSSLAIRPVATYGSEKAHVFSFDF
ncbi:MAG: hypothetical protein IJD37_01670, partial [Clostridia bacterium]|nr:hypothetical protein [Clostridia bacterium]